MANNADDQRPQADQDEAQSSTLPRTGPTLPADDANDVTVLASAPTLEAEEFPQGISPRELALTLKGQLLGHFHLQEFIGGGGMGAVFKALDTTLDRIVAVKVVASQSISSEDLQRRFLVEAQSTARLDHPNIARIHYVGRDRGLPYIVFEYIEGVNLRDLVINHGPIPLGDALSFTCQIAHALAHAWEKDVVHRDIKPSNILITRDGQAKLVDMGLARLHQVDAADDELTNTGVTLGTFDYISPEQARDPRDADTRSDIYSLGCTLFYMLIGRPPFAKGTAVQKLLKHQDQTPPNLSELRLDLPPSVARLTNSMLAKSPELRPQTPSELVQACYEVFRELGIRPPSSLAPLRVVPRSIGKNAWTAHLPWLIPVATLLLAVGWFSNVGRDTGASVEFAPLRFPTDSSTTTSVTTPDEKEASERLPIDTTSTTDDDSTSILFEQAALPDDFANNDGEATVNTVDPYLPPTMQLSPSSVLDLQAPSTPEPTDDAEDEFNFDFLLDSE